MGELAEALGRARQTAHGLATIDEALARSERSEERWCVAELLRIKGELVILQGASGANRAAEEHFRQSLDWSRQQEVLSWELRTTTSFARLLRDQRRIGEARTLRLSPSFPSPCLDHNLRARRVARRLSISVSGAVPCSVLKQPLYRDSAGVSR
jgi:predicted ATPase